MICFLLLFVLQEMVTVSVDGSVLDRIAKIMTYLRLGSSGKVLKKKKKEKEVKGISKYRSLSELIRHCHFHILCCFIIHL